MRRPLHYSSAIELSVLLLSPGVGGIGFRDAAHLAQSIIELPKPAYRNVKSLRALLSQIFRYQRPLPDNLRAEILRTLELRSRRMNLDGYHFQCIKEDVESAMNEHNRLVRNHDRRWEIARSLLEMSQTAWAFDSTHHYAFLSSQGLERNRTAISQLLFYQVAALFPEIIVTNDGKLSAKCDVEYKTISHRSHSELQFMYLVESVDCARAVWDMAFHVLSHIFLDSVYRGRSMDGQWRIKTDGWATEFDLSDVLRKYPISACLKISTLKKPKNTLCGTCAVVFSSDNQLPHVFSLVNDTITKYSQSEAMAWVRLVGDVQPIWLGDAEEFRWEDAARNYPRFVGKI